MLDSLDIAQYDDGFVVHHDFRGLGCGYRMDRCEEGNVPLWSHAQLFAIHDCVFRASLAGAKYAISGDIDELVYVKAGYDVNGALDKVFSTQTAGTVEGLSFDGQHGRACSMTHTYTVLGEGLLSRTSLRSLAMGGITKKATTVQKGVGSAGHCKWALDLAAVRDQTMPLHIHSVGSEETKECSNIPPGLLHINHLEASRTKRPRGRRHPNPRLYVAEEVADLSRVLVPGAVKAVLNRLSPKGAINSTSDELVAIHRCWIDAIRTNPQQGKTLSFLLPQSFVDRGQYAGSGTLCCSQLCKQEAPAGATSRRSFRTKAAR